MALVVANRVKETTTTTGTGTITLAGAVTNFVTFTSVLSDGDTTYYAIVDDTNNDFEVGLGTFTASGTTLARTTVLASSNSGNAVNLQAGEKEVFITYPAGKSVNLDASGDLGISGELIADSYNETYAAVTSSSNATTVNCETANSFSHTLTENTTFTFSNPPASGTAYTLSIEIIQDASASGYTVTWPTSVDWSDATAPTLTATASAKDIFVFYTRDGGTNWYGFTAGQAFG